jgi:hypothetical protein
VPRSEDGRNITQERFAPLRWGHRSFSQFRMVPPWDGKT